MQRWPCPANVSDIALMLHSGRQLETIKVCENFLNLVLPINRTTEIQARPTCKRNNTSFHPHIIEGMAERLLSCLQHYGRF